MKNRDKIILKADNGKYIIARVDNGQMGLYAEGNQESEAVRLNILIVDGWPVDSEPITVNLVTDDSDYVTLHGESVVLDKNGAVENRPFKVLWRGVGVVVLQDNKGKYVSQETNGNLKLQANRDKIGDWESFEMIKIS